MIKEILTNLYKIEVPLPHNPLKAVNSYIVKAKKRSLVVDTGMNREECLNVITSGLGALDIDTTRVCFFITHMHVDHSGLISNLATNKSTVYASQADASVIKFIDDRFWEKESASARMNGFPEDKLQRAVTSHPGYKYSSKGFTNFTIVKEGDTIGIGDYSFQCIETPGHTKGHMCLYEPKKKLIMSGDHILGETTPNISPWFNDPNPLKEYLSSLDKVYGFDVKLVLPGHGGVLRNIKGRIRALKHHHETRSHEILTILEGGKQNAFQVASQMSWDVNYKSWNQLHIIQKWFATGEALAHLRYLEVKGKVRGEIQGQKAFFSLK